MTRGKMGPDDSEFCRLSINAMIEDMAARHGAHLTNYHNGVLPNKDDEGAPVGYSVRMGNISAGRLPITIEWTPHRSHGRRRQATSMEAAVERDGSATPKLRDRIDRIIADTARLQRREYAVGRHGDGLHYPAWSFSIHATLASLLDHYGFDVQKAASVENLSQGRSAWAISRTNSGINSARQSSNAPEGKTPVLGSVFSEMTGSRLVFKTIIIPDISVTVEERPQEVVIYLHGRNIPDTARTALRGRNVAEILDHPGLRVADDVRIIGVTTLKSDGTLGLRLRQKRRPVAPAPDGVDTTWLEEG